MSKIILDTDIGYDPDDVFALLLALNLPDVDISLIVTADEAEGKRAALLRHVLRKLNRAIPIVRGAELGNHNFIVDELMGGGAGGVIEEDYVHAIKQVLDSAKSVTYVGIGGFTNLANFLKANPQDLHKLKIFMMGGAVDYSRGENWVEHNIRIDKNSAKYVLGLGGDLSMVMAQTTFRQEYTVDGESRIFRRLTQSDNDVHQLLVKHIELFRARVSRGDWPKMHDPLTLAAAAGYDFVKFHKSGVAIDEAGHISLSDKAQKISWSDPASKNIDFMKFLEERIFPQSY